MAETLAKLQASRAGYRAHLTQTRKKAPQIMAKETPSEPDLVSLNNILEQLARKKSILKELDERIAALLEDPAEIEKEIFDTEVIQEDIDETSSQISSFIHHSLSVKQTPPPSTSQPNQPNTSNQGTPPVVTLAAENTQAPPGTSSHSSYAGTSAPQGTLDETTASGTPQAPQIFSGAQPPLQVLPADIPNAMQTLSRNQAGSSNHGSRLPKLNLPTFTGNPLHWCTFWDSFEASVHCNANLSGVQKFSYLQAQLVGDASRAIAGFPLTNSNYEQAVNLLKERFGQPSKITNAHMQALLDLPSPSYHLTSLQSFYDSMESHVRGLGSLGKSHETYGDLLVPIVLGKLPHELRQNLAREHDSLEWKFQQLREAIFKEIRILEAGINVNSPNIPQPGSSSTVTSQFLTQTQGKQPNLTKSKTPAQRKCTYCKGPHPSYHCNVVTDCQQRWSIVKREGLCFNCLGNHKSTACQSKYRCHKCRGKHHTSLCPGEQMSGGTPTNPTASTSPPQGTSQQPASSVHATLAPITDPSSSSHVPPSGGRTSLLKTAIATVSKDHVYCEANILLDEGAQRSFITQTLANQLGLPLTETESISLSAFGAQPSASRYLPVATINVVTTHGDKIPLRVLVVEKIATPLQNHLCREIQDMPHLRGLRLAHPITSDEHFAISLLIGADHYWDIVDDTVIRGQGPTAVASKLGYLLSGPLQTSLTKPSETCVNLLHTLSSTKKEEFDLEQFWSLEAIGISPQSEKNDHETFLDNYINTSITRNPDGSFNAKFPWKEDCPILPTNYITCERRTRSMVRRLAATPQLLTTYGNIIAEQETRGFIERVDDAQPSDYAHYIPHHPVKKDSATTPIRIVYDCSFHSSINNPSLNDCLHAGPPFLNDMCSILLRFRTFTYGLSTDIEKAFLHVGLDESDRDFTRFFWLSNPEDPEGKFQVYRFKTVLFGSTSSPFMLNATLHHHLANYNTPAAEDMKENIYVDNIISGCNEEQDTVGYYEEARSIMNEAHFNLRSWSSNSPSLREQAVKDNTADANEIVNILGLKWNTSSDTLSLAPQKIFQPSDQPITKRCVLQISSKTYDPLGLLSPVTIRAKLLIQELWQQKLEWDEPLPLTLKTKWHSIAEDIQEASKNTLPRCFFSEYVSPTSTTYLHVFADSSLKAYGAVAYVSHGHQSSLVMAKSRVAPLKELTLPQLELMAALIGARLASFVSRALKPRYPNLKVKLWPDSEIVLHWLHSNKQLKPFIGNRTREIKSLFPVSLWSHCPTNDNPADLLTRGISATELHASTLWKHGPHWLPSESQWPSWNSSQVLHIQAPEAIAAEDTTDESTQTEPPEETAGIHCIMDVSRYSTLTKLLAVTAYVLRFVKNLQNRENRQLGPLSAKEQQQARNKWIQNCQGLTYTAEIANLLSRSSTRLTLVRQLRLFLDCDGFIRCGGRLHNAPLSNSAKFPYLLPPSHPLTKLIVYDAHRKQLHSGVNSTVTALRQDFWITSIRQYVRKLLRTCVTCRKLEGVAFRAPDPAPLPKLRVQETAPFAVTGVDFTGPLYVRSENSETKCYICLFTCAVTRAVHLEVVSDLTERSFLQAFRRFASHKSLPYNMISDNASTYLAAADELKQLFQSPSLKESLSRRGVEWQFIPKRAPWYGGFWERLIGLTKKAIKKTLGRAMITLTELQTLAAEVEAILNDRPITHVSSDVSDEEPLTPSHLLYGRRITRLPYPEIEDEVSDLTFGDDSPLRQRANKQALTLQQFWYRWKHEYLTSLREFHRSTGTNKQSIKKGEVVLVHDEKPRSTWKLAVVESLIEGGDGLIRAANIRTSTGRTNRPITKLYPLEVCANEAMPPTEDDTSEQAIMVPTPSQKRPRRAKALEAMQKIAEWARDIRAPPEDVE